jgi:gentisate 1,2-dioxygenase
VDQPTYTFVDRTGAAAEPLNLISPVLIPKEAIEAEVERLASQPAPENGRRHSLIVNPSSGAGEGLAPGTGVTLCVLKPGERTKPIRHNSSQVNFCIRGRGSAVIDGRRIDYDQYDVFNTPPWAVYEHVNDSNDIHVRLTYSNAPVLEKLKVHVVDENPPLPGGETAREDEHATDPKRQSPFGTFEIGNGAYLMPYEKLVSPDIQPFPALHWPWQRVKQELDKLSALGKSYVGRRLYLMFHPSTGRMNGTSANFFATITIRPANIVDKPHRHVAAAINYFFSGTGRSNVGGKMYTWKAGDLMLTAPGWMIHNHASDADTVYELTIQDSPLHIWMGSLLWQEDLAHPPHILGLSGGFQTNRAAQPVAG